MKRTITGLIGLAMLATPAMAAKPGDVKVTGQGTLNDGRIFNLSATLYQDGTAKGHATLINTNFSGDSGKGPYRAFIDISCAKYTPEGRVIIGGYVRRTNDSNLVDAVFWELQDNGKDDLLSRAYFWDDDPTTTGDPMACQLTNFGELPMEEVIRGNLNVNP